MGDAVSSARTCRPAFITAAEAAALVPSKATLAGDGFGMMGVADEVYAALERRFLESGSPHGLVLMHTSGQSNHHAGISRFAHRGMLSRVVGAHWGRTPRLSDLIVENAVEGVCLPQGQLAALYSAVASGRPGVLSRIGVGTFIDPRQDGGRVNEVAKRNIPADGYVRLVEIDGEELLLYRSQRIDVAIIRGTDVDEKGNLTQREEAAGLDSLALAQAARNSGGIVIAQAKNRVAAGSLAARDVVVPGMLIDYVVVAGDPAEHHRQANEFVVDDRLLGPRGADEADPMTAREEPADDERIRIGRRAARFIHPGDVINAGTGMPGDTIGAALSDAGLASVTTMTMESGVIGGFSVGALDFGAAYHPDAIITQARQFDFYNGGGVDTALMGVGQVDGSGDINVSMFRNRVTGVGGFMDIVDRASRVVFLVSARQPERKFVERVDQITFNGRAALAKRQEVHLVTDGMTFRLTEHGWELTDSDTDEDRLQAWLDRVPFPIRDGRHDR